ncbi:glycosyltransferase [Lacticaseibacillus suibinensis]|uniref:glycosyltransferase n=1 Tax=Lacticaseibacillus suibinensis TaxID=2486011 RepID=UPI0013DE1E47|nr:glycosyltransferase family 2 protein [Lacticaseibacillus suibinensis]
MTARIGISIIIPAYNEEKDIYRCVDSVYKNKYLYKEVIVVNDGSNDHTAQILESLLLQYPDLIVVNQKNSGKATALNNGILNYASMDLVMVLDGDSFIAEDALSKMTDHFLKDDRLIASATNVMIYNPTNIIEYAQKIEYLIGNKYKASEPGINLEYIIGGIGSTFRKEALVMVDGYSTDSITEDIDLSLKLIKAFGNKSAHIDYADDVVCYTPPAHNFSDLKKQRFRWKYGRFKALAKYRSLFFSTNLKKYSVTLTWWKLPKIVFFEEVMMLLDPFMVLFMLYILVIYIDFSVVLGSLAIYLVISLMASLSDEHLTRKETVLLALSSPATLPLLYIINVVDFYSLVKSIALSKEILLNENKISHWTHIER